MKRLDRGESFIVTRNGVPVGELRPIARRRSVRSEEFVAALEGLPPIDLRQLRLDQDPTPRV
jgi:antitoxin (DNA-binding transcriptional repressor) of toxin-antitoxin stability system